MPTFFSLPIRFVATRTCARWLAWVCLLLLSLSCSRYALAQTPVSGVIATPAHWTVASSPYLVSGEVVIQQAALLRIDAGVTVYMAAGAGVTVQSGSIQALGTAAAPITVLSDKTRLGQVAAPGDWKQWVFNRGTVNTRLEHVNFAYGSGLAVNGAAPVFNFVDVRNSAGAAMSIDLAASPSGIGNQAVGNTVNGVAVPAGDILGSVNWALRGIPYVVASGVVSVGVSPTIDTLTPKNLQQGQSGTFNVTGSRLSGLQSVHFDQAGLSAQVLAGATDTQASLAITAGDIAPLGIATMRLLTDAGEVPVAGGLTITQAQPTLLSLTPSTLYLGQGNVNISVQGTGLSAQSSLLINGVAAATQFVSATQLRSTLATPAAAGNLALTLRTPDPIKAGQYLISNQLDLPVVSTPLALAPTSLNLALGAKKTFTLALPYVAPSGGLSVSLVSSAPGVASVPANVTVAEGQTAVSFELNALALGATFITASKNGYASAQAQVTVIAPPTLTLAPASLTLGVGRKATLTVTSSVVAGSTGLQVALSSSNPTIATLPAALTIPAGSSSATVMLDTVAIGDTTITAQASEFANGSTAVIVRPVSLNLPAAALVAPGLVRSLPLSLSDPAPAGGLVVTLASSNPAVASVPASITLAEGQSNANFLLSGVTVGTATLSAKASGYQAGGMPVTVESVTINVAGQNSGTVSMAAGQSAAYVVSMSRPAPAGGVTVNFSSADTAIATADPQSIVIAEGQTSGGLATVRLLGVAKGSTVLTASADGLKAAALTLNVLAKPEFKFNTATVPVGKGMQTYQSELYVMRNTGTSSYSPSQAVTLRLTSSDTGKVAVPASVTIPADASYVYFPVTGVGFTNGVPVTIDATADGYNAPTAKLAVSVLPPVFTFSGLDTLRSSSSARNGITLGTIMDGASYATNQVAAADMAIDLTIADGVPADVVSGFYSDQTAGTVLSRVMLAKGANTTSAVYVATPTAAGSYKVQAGAAGVATVKSPLVTVTAPQLKFSKSSFSVIKGFKTYLYEVNIYRAVNGTAFNGAGALTVNLTSSNPAKVSVPASVTIAANASSANFYVTGVELTNDTPVVIDASAVGFTAPATKLTVSAVAPVISFSEIDTNRSPASGRDNFYLSFSSPNADYAGNQVAVADMAFDLAISAAEPTAIVGGFYTAANAGTATSQLILRSGSNTTGYAYVGVPTASGTYRLQASSGTWASATSGLVTVNAPELRFNNSKVIVGKGLNTYYAEIYIRRMANGSAVYGGEALTVNLQSSDPSKVRVPATVTIPANEYYVYLPITGVDLTASTPVTVHATASGYSDAASNLAVSVATPVFTFNSLDVNRSQLSPRDQLTLSVTTPNAEYSGSQPAASDLPIKLSIVAADPAGIVDGFYGSATGGAPVTQVTMPGGATSTGNVYVGVPAAGGSYQVQANAVGVASTTSAKVTVAAPELGFSTSTVYVGKGLRTYSSEVYVRRMVNGSSFAGTAPLTVNLTCSSSAVCKVPTSVTIPADAAYVYFTVEGVAIGSTTVTATAPGYAATTDLKINVVAPTVLLSGLSASGTVGGKDDFTVYFQTPNAEYSGSQPAVAPLSVNLTSSNPDVASVPASVTVAAGSTSSGSVDLTGVAPGTTTVTASGAGMTSTTSATVTIK